MRMKMSTVRAFLLILLACFVLGSCALFFASPFPATLPQTMAQRDLSAYITDTTLDKFQPFVLESGTTRLILLVGGFPYPNDKPWLFILKEDLSLAQNPFTLGELNTIASPFNGTRAMIDVNGNVVVGTAVFTIAGDTIVPLGNTGGMGGLNSWGFPVVSFGGNTVNVRSTGLMLEWDRYLATWASAGPMSCNLRPTASSSLWLQNVLADPDPASTSVILVFSGDKDSASGDSLTHFVKVPRADFGGGMQPNFMDAPLLYPTVTKTKVDGWRVGCTVDGIVAYDSQKQDYIKFAFDAPDTVERLHVGNTGDDRDTVKVAWSFSGGYTCAYDPRTRTLSKAANWWQ